jgi:hypothetical protein
MTEAFYSYDIRSGWEGRVDTPASIGAKFTQTLDALGGIDPIFANWQIADSRKSSLLSLDEAQSRMASLIENGVVRDDFNEPAPEDGYHACALAGEVGDPRRVGLRVHAGGKGESWTWLKFADFDVAPDLTIVTFPLCKRALLTINAIWQAPWACVQAFREATVAVPIDFGGVQATRIDSVAQVPSDPTFPYSIFHIPWIAYLSAERAAGLKLSPEIQGERTPDGGLLMTATTQRLDPTNPEHARRARILAETLIACTGYSSS